MAPGPEYSLVPEDLKKHWITQARVLLVDGHDTASARCAARWARRAMVPVVADTDNRYPGIKALLDNVDYLICSEQFPERMTHEADLLQALPLLMNRFKIRLSAATLGARGVLAWDGARFHYSPAFAIEAVDTTGAGDVFHAAFIYALLAKWDLDRQLRFSCAAAGLSCTGMGARGGIRPLRAIERLLRNGKLRKSAYSRRVLASAERSIRKSSHKQSL